MIDYGAGEPVFLLRCVKIIGLFKFVLFLANCTSNNGNSATSAMLIGEITIVERSFFLVPDDGERRGRFVLFFDSPISIRCGQKLSGTSCSH